MSLCDKTDAEIRKLIDDAYTGGYRACLDELLKETRRQLRKLREGKDVPHPK